MKDIPPEIARAVMADMQAFFAEPSGHKQDAIAAETLERLRPHQPKYGKRLRIMDIKEMFRQMRDEH